MATQKPQTIDAYLQQLDDPTARKTLTALRAQLHKLLPGATETISYQMPTLKVDGNSVAGFAFFGQNCGLYPFSGGVIPKLSSELRGYKTSKSGVSFPPDKPLPVKIVKAVVQGRLAEISERGKGAPKKKSGPAAPKRKASLITERVTDTAVKEATGRDWKAWMQRLDKARAAELNHKQLVALLAEEVESGWWQQSISVAYEQSRGKRVVGETADTGFQVGVQRTLPITAAEAWKLVTGQPQRWLGAGARAKFEPGETYEVPKRRGVPAVRGLVRAMKPGQRVRMTYHPEGWKEPATLQVTLLPKATGVSFHVHMEKLPDGKAREAMREHWAGVLERLASAG